MIILRQSTAGQEIPLGYFLDSGDGDAEETGLTIANTDIKIWKFGATTLANKNSGGATHISNGIYYCVLDATDTNTLGSLIIFIHVSGALACKVDCVVWPANVYDALIAGTDYLQTDGVQVSGTSQTANDNGADINTLLTRIVGTLASGTHSPQSGDSYPIVNSGTYGNSALKSLIDTLDTIADAIKLVTDNLPNSGSLTDLATLASRLTAARAGYLDELGPTNIPADVDTLISRLSAARATNLDELAAANIPSDIDTLLTRIVGTLATGTHNPQSGDSYPIVNSGTYGNSALKDLIDALNNLSPAGAQSACAAALVAIHLDHLLAADYDPAAKPGVATALLNEVVENDAGVSRFTQNALEQGPGGGSAPTKEEIADQVWDEILSGHLGAGSTGAALNAAGGAGDPWITNLPGSYTGSQAGKIIGDMASLKGGVGSIEVTLYIRDNNQTIIADVDVEIRASNDATAAVVATGKSDSFGVMQPKPKLDAGTYYVWRQKTGKNFTNPQTIVVS